jgi:DNA-binding transcriptional ArsR family regulator
MPSTLREFKADLFRSLGSPVRIQILEELRREGTMTVSELQRRVGVDASNLSQHLAVLRARSVVAGERQGTNVHYSVTDPSVFLLLDAAHALFDQQVAHRRSLLEGPDR